MANRRLPLGFPRNYGGQDYYPHDLDWEANGELLTTPERKLEMENAAKYAKGGYALEFFPRSWHRERYLTEYHNAPSSNEIGLENEIHPLFDNDTFWLDLDRDLYKKAFEHGFQLASAWMETPLVVDLYAKVMFGKYLWNNSTEDPIHWVEDFDSNTDMTWMRDLLTRRLRSTEFHKLVVLSKVRHGRSQQIRCHCPENINEPGKLGICYIAWGITTSRERRSPRWKEIVEGHGLPKNTMPPIALFLNQDFDDFAHGRVQGDPAFDLRMNFLFAVTLIHEVTHVIEYYRANFDHLEFQDEVDARAARGISSRYERVVRFQKDDPHSLEFGWEVERALLRFRFFSDMSIRKLIPRFGVLAHDDLLNAHLPRGPSPTASPVLVPMDILRWFFTKSSVEAVGQCGSAAIPTFPELIKYDPATNGWKRYVNPVAMEQFRTGNFDNLPYPRAVPEDYVDEFDDVDLDLSQPSKDIIDMPRDAL
ncbi:hypothetical protein BT63DRAFT_420693 [Microthyrium microscopicum]|uniref:Uncharacterized protein n=1 Tax=Microthyrium microscopicum TaxID=703497 RepID=A0A6A6UT33_9PEZI|nr:hypothetical protein BT63DRAFT_420693 [Microthyrium microscopicum]